MADDSGYDPQQYVRKAADWVGRKEADLGLRKRATAGGSLPLETPQTKQAPSGLELLGSKAKEYVGEKASQAKKYLSDKMAK